MPLIINKTLGCYELLEQDRIGVFPRWGRQIPNKKAYKIGILNLMPTKVDTEYQLLRILGKSEYYLDVDFLYTKSYEAKNTSERYLEENYKIFEEIKGEKFDGFIITGAPVETLEFKDVAYWNELTEIMDYLKENCKSIIYICWGAQAGLYYHYGIPKYPLDKKMFGVFKHNILDKSFPLFEGFGDTFYAPHSRHTEIKKEDIEKLNDLIILAVSEEAGVHVVASKDGKHIFFTGHGEYDKYTLKKEYERDVNKGLDIDIPKNYF